MATQFKQGTLGAKYLEELKGTEALVAFEAAGEKAFHKYYEISFSRDSDGARRDKALRDILGDDLADRIAEANGIVYGMKIPLHNHYIAWARTQWDVEPKF